MVFFGIDGGMLADVIDRRLLALLSAIVAWGSTLCIALLAWFRCNREGFRPALGGLVIIVAVILLLRLQPAFRQYDAMRPEP
jgi:hypothetical protein